MTDRQKFLFDTSGFLVLEEVLKAGQCTGLIEALHRIMVTPKADLPRGLGYGHKAESFESHVGSLWNAGLPFTDLIDLPPVIEILHEIIHHEIRLESAYCFIRHKGYRGLNLHGGGHWDANGQDYNLMYRHFNGKIFSANTVVAFCLTDENDLEGGFACIPGSHKANFSVPEDVKNIEQDGIDHSLVKLVPCKKGSVVIFPEALCHGAGPWNSDKDRITIFYKYSHVGMKFRPGFPTKEAMEGMTENQRLFFAEVHSDSRAKRVPHRGT
ncbi:MAG: phytanoyl-CoA dioxygenase family protein [Planctomycetota bacterium]|nr:phytanoyl-CoA dioxygenase family protein [Planctomycetota bacterium]MDA1141738.1 phytanoyl-CoA dioxygenase family protein [Planctomycetota bacterium]